MLYTSVYVSLDPLGPATGTISVTIRGDAPGCVAAWADMISFSADVSVSAGADSESASVLCCSSEDDSCVSSDVCCVVSSCTAVVSSFCVSSVEAAEEVSSASCAEVLSSAEVSSSDDRIFRSCGVDRKGPAEGRDSHRGRKRDCRCRMKPFPSHFLLSFQLLIEYEKEYRLHSNSGI